MTLEMFLAVAGFAGALVAGAWGLIKLAARQFDKSLEHRFTAQERVRQEASAAHERRFVQLEDAAQQASDFRLEVMRDFIRREDYIRDIASIKIMVENLGLNVEKKLDAIWQEFRKKT